MRSEVCLFTKDEFSEVMINESSASEVLLDVKLVCVGVVLTQL